jgi:hypothetical protein
VRQCTSLAKKDIGFRKDIMSPSTKLTDEEKQRGKRKLLIPSKEIQELMPRVHAIGKKDYSACTAI